MTFQPHLKEHQEKFATRFWSKVDKTIGQGPAGTCWIWQAGKYPFGYGQFWDTRIRKGNCAHRVAWELTQGSIPEQAHLCHKCDNPSCVNPEHLFPGTPKDNAQDRSAKGRNNIPCGQASRLAKLSEVQVQEIVLLIQQGISHTVIARQYGVSRQAITLIAKGKNWKHITKQN